MGIRWELLRPPFVGDKINITDKNFNKVNGYFIKDLGNGKFIFEEALTIDGHFRFIFDKKWINRGWVKKEDAEKFKQWIYYNSLPYSKKRRISCNLKKSGKKNAR